jgi:hypothetical protein
MRSTAAVVRFRTVGLLRSGWLALHLFLGILRRCRDITGCTVHRAGRCVLIGGRAGGGTGGLTGISGGRSRTCVVCARGFSGHVAGTGLGGAGAKSHHGAAGENDLFRVHLPLLYSFPVIGCAFGAPRRMSNQHTNREFPSGENSYDIMCAADDLALHQGSDRANGETAV